MITHEHPDHWTPDHLDRILKNAPGIPIYGPEGVAKAAAGYEITVVNARRHRRRSSRSRCGSSAASTPSIHHTIPVIDNVGVLVNDALYYPGDSYAVPKGVDVKLLAAPLGAPWLNIGEAMDFVLAVAPRQAFGTHDMGLSVIGRTQHRARLQWATEKNGGEFLELEAGDGTDL